MKAKQKKEIIFVGVRSTGTETLVRLETPDGLLIGTGRAGPANICFSVKDAWHSVNEAFHDALEEALIDLKSEETKGKYLFYAGIGIKGTELAEKCDAFKNSKHPFEKLILQSDGYVDCLGAHNGNDGAAIVVDEGVVAHQIEDGKKPTKLGGWGFPHADEGSSAWLGCEAVRHTLQWQDGYIDESPLLKKVFHRFNNDLSDLVTFATRASPRNYAGLASMVIDSAKENDEYAVRFMQKAAAFVENIFNLLNKKADNKNLPYCLFGELAVPINPWLSEDIRKRIVQPHADGSVGAVLMIKNALQKQNQKVDS